MLCAFRRRRVRSRLSLLAVLALLWSQMALALHADCVSIPGNRGTSPAAQHAECTANSEHGKQAVCTKHCQDGGSGVDTARAAFTVPTLLPAVQLAVTAVADLAAHSPEGPPTRRHKAWHGPTSHPASILLI